MRRRTGVGEDGEDVIVEEEEISEQRLALRQVALSPFHILELVFRRERIMIPMSGTRKRLTSRLLNRRRQNHWH